MYEFGRVIGNPVVLLAGDRPFSTLCAYVAMGMEREVRGVSVYKGQGLGGGRREEVFVMSAWSYLQWIMSCDCCFDVMENDRLVILCLFAVAQVSWWRWVGGDRGGGGLLEPIIMIVWVSLEQIPSTSCCPLSRKGK